MNENILVVDDDLGVVKLLELLLTKHSYSVCSFTDPNEALETFKLNSFDLIISDFFMPVLDGEQFLSEVRKMNQETPLIFLTANSDINKVIELFRKGANDYIVKPFSNQEILYRIEKTLKDAKNKKIVDRIEKERRIRDSEINSLVNWRLLYAYKENSTVDQMLLQLRRNIDQKGGYLWIDIFKKSLEKIDESHYKVDKSIVDLILEVSTKDKEVYDIITFLTGLKEMALEQQKLTFEDVYHRVKEFIAERLLPLAKENDLKLSVENLTKIPAYELNIEPEYFLKVINELLINAIKYSVKDSTITLLFNFNTGSNPKQLTITVRNKPRQMNQQDLDGNPIIGIPYEYSELVFDLFYTIEPYYIHMEGEEWTEGTGLYICRRLLKMQNCLLETSNGLDYTGDEPEQFLSFNIIVPIEKI